MGSTHAVRRVLSQQSFNSVFVREVVVFAARSLLRIVFASAAFFELAIPHLFNSVDLALAEFDPFTHLFFLSSHFPGDLAILEVCVTVLIVKSSLGKISEFKSNLGDLAHIGSTGSSTGRE